LNKIQTPYNSLQHLEYLAHQLNCWDKVAVVDHNRKLTYREIYSLSRKFGIALLNSGICTGDQILVCLPDSADFITVFLGCLFTGIIPVVINPAFGQTEINEIVQKSTAKNVICTEAKSKHFYQRGWNLILITDSDCCGMSVDRYAVQFHKDIETPVTLANDDAFIYCTSGTTGQTKLVMHLQKSICGTGLQYGTGILKVTSRDVIFSAAKLSHAYGLGNSLSIPFTHGATVILESELPTPDCITQHIQQHGVTIFCGVPRHYTSLLSYNRSVNIDSLRICLSAGESLPKQVGQDFSSKYNVDIIDAIGSTELLGFALSTSSDTIVYGTTGKPVDGCEIKLVDNGHEVIGAGVGELYVKSPYAATKYFNDPESTEYTFKDGWIKTNDMYQRDADGNFVHYGRQNDCIKVNAVYVSLTMLEKSLYNIKSVADSAAVSYTNKYGLNRIKICVVLHQGYDSQTEYVRILKSIKTNEQIRIPFIIKFVDSIPRTVSGKIKKYML